MKENSQPIAQMTQDDALPIWLPDAMVHYIEHTQKGRSIRALARDEGVHASTISRQVRKVEGLRDDPLIDGALQAVEAGGSFMVKRDKLLPILRKMAVPGTILVAGRSMSRAVLLREGMDGSTAQLGPVEIETAQSLAMRHWILGEKMTKVARYHITALGRAELMRSGQMQFGFCEAQTPFVEAQTEDNRPWRYGQAESAVASLARRRGADGAPFLQLNHVNAAETLQEDYELARLDQPHFTTIEDIAAAKSVGKAQTRSLKRLQDALACLGDDLGSITLLCCCQLQGLEQAEKTLGWPARSGKLVLKIALERLHVHYVNQGVAAALIR